jgi:hypothetical protein
MPGLARICGARRKPRQENRGEETPAAPLDALCLKMSNNAAERASRPIALGRTNFFTGSGAGGRRAAIIYILIKSATLNVGGR